MSILSNWCGKTQNILSVTIQFVQSWKVHGWGMELSTDKQVSMHLPFLLCTVGEVVGFGFTLTTVMGSDLES